MRKNDIMERTDFQEYWRYYIHLEALLIKTFDFVALTRDNFFTYSNQYASILRLTGAELDAFFKYYINSNGRNIKDYMQSFAKEHHELIEQEVEILDSDIILKPFEKCEGVLCGNPMFWWKAFTDIKHNRVKNFLKANLCNCLNALAALYMIECQCIRDIAESDGEIDIPVPESKLFSLANWDSNYMLSSHLLIGKTTTK
jgi:hypothetical protein